MAAGLTLIQSNEIKKYFNLRNVFQENAAIVATYPPFQNKVNEFLNNLTLLQNELPKKDVTSKGLTELKKKNKLDVALFYDEICSVTSEYALNNNYNNLYKAVNYSKSKLFRTRDINLLPLILSINATITNQLQNPLFNPYQITASMLASGLAKATDFNNSIQKNIIVLKSQRVSGSIINNLLKPLRANCQSFKRHIKWYKQTNPTFHDTVKKANKSRVYGTRITKVQGCIYQLNTNIPIPNATIKIVKYQKTFTSDQLGNFLLQRFRGGLHQVEISAPGFLPIYPILRIHQGKHHTQNFYLEPQHQ